MTSLDLMMVSEAAKHTRSISDKQEDMNQKHKASFSGWTHLCLLRLIDWRTTLKSYHPQIPVKRLWTPVLRSGSAERDRIILHMAKIPSRGH